MNTEDAIKEIGLSDLEWRFVWHGSGGKDLWNRRGGRICIGSVNYDELLYVGENQFDLDNAKSLIERHNSDLLAVAQSKNAEIEKLKAENERLKAVCTDLLESLKEAEIHVEHLLIAAAPDLLAALESMVAEYGEFYGDTPEVAAQYQSPLIKAALQAIAKAKGETK